MYSKACANESIDTQFFSQWNHYSIFNRKQVIQNKYETVWWHPPILCACVITWYDSQTFAGQPLTFWQLPWVVYLCLSALCVCVCLRRRHLAQNPFICDCHLKWLADYLQDNPIETSGARCTSPRRLANKRIGQIKSKKFRCSGTNERTTWQTSGLHSSSSDWTFTHAHAANRDIQTDKTPPTPSLLLSYCFFLLGIFPQTFFSLNVHTHTHTFWTYSHHFVLFPSPWLSLCFPAIAREQYVIPGIVHPACVHVWERSVCQPITEKSRFGVPCFHYRSNSRRNGATCMQMLRTFPTVIIPKEASFPCELAISTS